MSAHDTPATGSEASHQLERLLVIMARLRDPQGGCPWDLEQDFSTIAPYTIEEAYEVADAIDRGDLDDLCDELGDLLLQVVFHARMAEEQGAFAFADVARAISDKMQRRHPHVFDKENLKTDEDVKKRWDEIKALENAEKAKQGKLANHRRTLDAVKAGSALMQAQELQKTANKVGFDWDVVSGAVDKLDEEVAELKEILPIDGQKPTPEQKALLEKELGDCFFALVNIARKLGIAVGACGLD